MNILKNNTITLALTLMAAWPLAAQTAIDDFFGAYVNDPNYTTVSVSSKMFSLFSNIDTDDPDSQALLDAMSDLRGIKILTADHTSTDMGFANVIKRVHAPYEELMSVNNGEEQVRFFVLDKGNTIEELFMVVGAEGHLVLMSITGDIDLNKLAKLSKRMNIGDMNYLENLGDKDEKGE